MRLCSVFVLAMGAVLLAVACTATVSATTITMDEDNKSWLTPSMWNDNLTPHTDADYTTALVGTNRVRTSPAGGTAGGNADFTGNSLTVVGGTNLLYKQLAGETAAINGGAGDLILDGQGNAVASVQFAPNGQQTGTTTLNVDELVVASDSAIESGYTLGGCTMLLDAVLTGPGDLWVRRQGVNGDGNDKNPTTLYSIADVSGYTGDILVTRDSTLDFNVDHVFPGSLSLVDGPDAGGVDRAELNVDRVLSFNTVHVNGPHVGPGTYSGTDLDNLIAALGGFFLNGGGTLIIREVPEPSSAVLLMLGALALACVRSRS